MPAGSDGCVKILLHKGNLRVNTHLDSRAKDAPLVRLCNLTLISAWKKVRGDIFSDLFLDLPSVLCGGAVPY